MVSCAASLACENLHDVSMLMAALVSVTLFSLYFLVSFSFTALATKKKNVHPVCYCYQENERTRMKTSVCMLAYRYVQRWHHKKFLVLLLVVDAVKKIEKSKRLHTTKHKMHIHRSTSVYMTEKHYRSKQLNTPQNSITLPLYHYVCYLYFTLYLY